MFDTTKQDLKDILRNAKEGKLQLPDFQRSYVWGEYDVISLLASIGKGFPVGALLTLEAGGAVNFKPRTIEGVQVANVTPEELLLDGQQRITSLYQAAYSEGAVKTKSPKNQEVQRFFYINIAKALQPGFDFEDAIVSVPGDKLIKTDFGRTIVLDLRTRENEFKEGLFPFNKAFDSRDWFYEWRDYWRGKDETKVDLEHRFYRDILQNIERYKMPVIRLDKSNSREAICLVFEKVNVGGKKLDAFELVTAIYAAANFDLRKDWLGDGKIQGRQQRMWKPENKLIFREVLSGVASTEFLQACTLLHTRRNRLEKEKCGASGSDLPQINCNRDALLGLPLSAYQEFADKIETGFVDASAFLNEWKIVWSKDVPYPPLIVGLACVYGILDRTAKTVTAKEKISTWFWSATLGEIYSSGTDSKLSRDVPALVDWILEVGQEPKTVREAIFQQKRLDSLYSRNSAAYKGIHALLMASGCKDFITGKEAELANAHNDQMDIHHIFPKAWCKNNGIERRYYDSIINKTALSAESNRSIGGDAPSEYLARIQRNQKLSEYELDDILTSHLIEPALLRANDFPSFFAARRTALTSLLEKHIMLVKDAPQNESGRSEDEGDYLDEDES